MLFSLAENEWSTQEPEIMKYFANFYAILYLILLACYLPVVVLFFIVEKPQTEYQQFVLSAVYPFETESLTSKILLYSNHTIVILHSATVIAFDGIAVFLIFKCTYRLKVLEHNFGNVRNFIELTYCIQEHVNFLR